MGPRRWGWAARCAHLCLQPRSEDRLHLERNKVAIRAVPALVGRDVDDEVVENEPLGLVRDVGGRAWEMGDDVGSGTAGESDGEKVGELVVGAK